jgi:hypothetical protein
MQSFPFLETLGLSATRTADLEEHEVCGIRELRVSFFRLFKCEVASMNPGVIVPLAAFAFVVVIVALVNTAKIHDLETETHYRLSQEELDHRSKLEALDRELERTKREARDLRA